MPKAMVLLILTALATTAQGQCLLGGGNSIERLCFCTPEPFPSRLLLHRRRGVQPRHCLHPHLDQLLCYSLRLTVKQTPSPQRTSALATMARRKRAPTASSTKSRTAQIATLASTSRQRTTVIRTYLVCTCTVCHSTLYPT